MNKPPPKYLTIAEFCAAFDLNPEKVWDAINEGVIPFELAPPTYARMGIPVHDAPES